MANIGIDRKIVVMAEKENVAKAIAKGIGLKNQKTDKSHFIYGKLDDIDTVVTFTNGHILELLEPENLDSKYKIWNSYDLPISFDDSRLKVKSKKEALYQNLRREVERASIIINAGDTGREGELIQRWVIKMVFKNRKAPDIYRLWTQSMTEKAIQKAYDDLRGDDETQEVLDNLFNSGRARIIMDKFFGINYSRLLTLNRGNGSTIVYGRCQSPIINAIIQRENEIREFVPQKYSYINIGVGEDILASLVEEKDNRFSRIEFQEDEQYLLLKKIRTLGNYVMVEKKEIDRKAKCAPFLHDILSLQKYMAKVYGYEAHETLDICEKLYNTYHILSYPRTESRHLTEDLKSEIKYILTCIDIDTYKGYIDIAKKNAPRERYFNNKKVIDHHALIPTIPEDINLKDIYKKLSFREKKVYDEILRSFIAIFLPSYEYDIFKILLKDERGNLYFFTDKADITLGYKKLWTPNEKSIFNYTDLFSKERTFKIHQKKIIKAATKPKVRFTTSGLLDFMNLNNIGTGATRDEIIKELVSAKGINRLSYIKKEGKHFIPTEFGEWVNNLIPEDIKSIDYLSILEDSIKAVEQGKMNFDEFITFIKEEYDLHSKKITPLIIENKFKSDFHDKKESNLRCPICDRPLKKQSFGYSCTGYTKDKKSCNFIISNKYFDKKLSDTTIKKLITTGKSNKLSFTSMEGDKYSAFLKMEIIEGKAKLTKVK